MFLHSMNYQQGNSTAKNAEQKSFVLINASELHLFTDEEVNNVSLSDPSIYELPLSKEDYSIKLSYSVLNSDLPHFLSTSKSFVGPRF